ncbi:glycosyltransferase [Campylobacter coli]|uniref:Glycosyltransferase n=7 Tax=Campylobacter coli TaxID=195 RepID=A0A5T1VUT3_CAMCO|nr:glycosyltransferase [Campylobacter coli]EIA70235.1 capsular polysaccharide heptosyltransferase [Campylobacter coli 7--1]APA59242.1 capsule biosynthesis protein CapA [Campylobacter coli]EAH4472475.1 glycosyltransferase [Campylobacter coli]EAH6039254.1 glycosyltransferase [Campylobacter coli]EAH7886883.1 glycosyltransferase [Campylobacter coli]
MIFKIRDMYNDKKYQEFVNMLERYPEIQKSFSYEDWRNYLNGLLFCNNFSKVLSILQNSENEIWNDEIFLTSILNKYYKTSNELELQVVYHIFSLYEKFIGKFNFNYRCAFARYNYILQSKTNTRFLEISQENLSEFEILIPTYQRRDIVKATVLEILSINPKIKITVFDNNSEDGTFDELSKLISVYENFNILKNSENLGFARNVCNCIKYSTRKYIHLISDENPSIVVNVLEGVKLMKEKKLGVLSGIYVYNHGKLGTILAQGKSFESQIKPQEFFDSSAYFTGLLFDGELLRKYLYTYQPLLEHPGNIYWYIFPTIIALIFSNGAYFDCNLIRGNVIEGERFLEKENRNIGGTWGLITKWQQYHMFMSFFDNLKKTEQLKQQELDNIHQMIQGRSAVMMKILFHAAQSEFPQCKEYFSYFDYSEKMALDRECKILKSMLEKIKNDVNVLDSDKKALNNILKNYKVQEYRNDLPFQVGLAMIRNSKSIFGYIKIFFVISDLIEKYKNEDKQNDIIPSKNKESFTYKLGELTLKAHNTWYKGGYINLYFQVKKLKKEIQKKGN